ncbi:hypothetical protein LOAG_10098 [Loa loa]|uniref:G-protein coupled receptors family 1 profile domain-containing protein n=1 Tax=Loa loa TaxID=7209 RepID=A0A1S0TQK1_LOALO|nr:hypothetical protein LOAG_10098 [Loa loa]EFO18397.1 hypothetical protein LOAG_10098 [Loa loa]
MNDCHHLNNSNNYFNSIDSSYSFVPACTSLGFSCPRLYTVKRLISYIATIGNFIVIPFILYLIVAKVKDGFFKHFTLNLMITCITSTIAALIIDIINVMKLFISITGNNSYLAEILAWARFYVKFGSIWFHALTLYAVIVCYLPYMKPIFYSKYFVNRSQKSYYVALHISTILWGSFITILFKEYLIPIPYFLTHITLFIVLFIAALIGSIKIGRYKMIGVDSIRVAKMQQKRLYSFITYSYSIEVITFPMFVSINFRCGQLTLSSLRFLHLSHIAVQLFHCYLSKSGHQK